MSFTCTPGQLAAHVIASLAVLDAVSLSALWQIAAAKSTSAALDNLQKNIIWASLMGASPGLISAKTGPNGSEVLPIDENTPYGKLLLHGTELEIFIEATEKCQFRYLTGTENYHSLKVSLGDFPFRLLRVIARHGAEGILNPDLARESDQDARSIRLRLIKLEQAGLIVTKSVYVDKKHTTHSWHTKFVTAKVQNDNETDDDLEATRDVCKLKRLIVDALQKAPNQLRGFSDLRKELKLDGSLLASKFFRSVCIRLHRAGYVEKLNVELPETKQRLYALRFTKPLPKDLEDLEMDEDDGNDMQDEFDQEDETLPEEQATTPVLNKVFPPFTQIFQHIYDRGEKGITSGEIAKALLGTSDYRPYIRLFELLPTYLSNGKTLKPCKKYVDLYDDYTVSKLYDNEGKLRFYRYFVKQFCKEDKPAPKVRPKPKASKDNIVKLNDRLHSSLGKISHEVLIEKKRRSLQTSDQPPAKRPRIEKRPSLEIETPPVPEEIIDAPRRRRRTAKVSYNFDDQLLDDENNLEDDYTPQPEEDGEAADSSPEPSPSEVALAATEAADSSKPTLSSTNLPKFVPQPKEPKKSRTVSQGYKSEGSARAVQRRQQLLDIIRQEGGATYSSSVLCRKIDERMNNPLVTDVKTLARDVMFCAKNKDLEIQKVSINLGEQQVEKKLLVLTKPEERPTEERLEELRQAYAAQHSRKDIKVFQKRLIQLDMRLYIENPKTKKVSSGTAKRRGKNRLPALGDTERESLVKDEPTEGVLRDEGDALSNLKRTRRPRKVAAPGSADGTQTTGKRGRRNIKMEKSEALMLFRAVVISKTFSRLAIDFDEIATLFPDKDGQIVKQKWGTVRRLFGGADVVSQGVLTFQQMIIQGVEEGSITEEELSHGDLKFFLEYWREYDNNFDLPSFDEMPLYNSWERNANEYNFPKEEVQTTSLAEKIEDISMRQKESLLSQSVFAEADEPLIKEKKHEDLRSIFKSIFLTSEEKQYTSFVNRLLEEHGETAIKEATNGLTSDREVLLVSMDDTSKFILGDKFKNALVNRLLTKDFFNRAASFKDVLVSLSTANKGLVLSQGVLPGEMASLLQLISDYSVDLLRVDRDLKFDSYESRLIDKEQLACDLVLKCNVAKVTSMMPKPVSIPFEGPCQPIWFDVNANLNKPLWIKIITTLLNYIVFKPGVTDEYLFGKTHVVLSVKNYNYIMKWLLDTECVKQLSSGGYLPTDKWQYILGSGKP